MRTPRNAPRSWASAAVAAVAAIAVLDVIVGPRNNLSGTLGLAPFLAAMGSAPGVTALVGTLAIGVSAVLAWMDGVPRDVAMVRVLVVVASAIGATVAAARRTHGERRLTAMTRVADVAQHAILPPLPSRAVGFEIAATYVSATEDARVGGDFYDMVTFGDSARLIVGDVRGKGLDAVSLAAAAARAFRDAALTTALIDDIPARIESTLAPRLGLEDFITCVMVELRSDGRVALVNCGHPPPFVVASGAASSVAASETHAPIGLGSGARAHRIDVAVGARLLLYTDGLIEARRADGSFVSIDRIIGRASRPGVRKATSALLRALEDESGGRLGDDLVIIMLERRGPTAIAS